MFWFIVVKSIYWEIVALVILQQLWKFTLILRTSFHIAWVLLLTSKLSTSVWYIKLPTAYETTCVWIYINDTIKSIFSGNVIVLIPSWLLINISARKQSSKRSRAFNSILRIYQEVGKALALLGTLPTLQTQVHSQALWSSWEFESSKTQISLGLTLSWLSTRVLMTIKGQRLELSFSVRKISLNNWHRKLSSWNAIQLSLIGYSVGLNCTW